MESEANRSISPKEFKDLEIGYKFSPVSYELTPSSISKFEEAVGTCSPDANLVPPLATLIYAMKAVFQCIEIPPGSIHASQEAEFLKPVAIGSRLNYHAQIAQKTSRSKMNIIAVKINAFDQDKEMVLSAVTTLITPNSS